MGVELVSYPQVRRLKATENRVQKRTLALVRDDGKHA
jgi:hypothetical protein